MILILLNNGNIFRGNDGLVVPQGKVLAPKRYLPKYLGMNPHATCNSLSNDSAKPFEREQDKVNAAKTVTTEESR